jgi:hypothetical protein
MLEGFLGVLASRVTCNDSFPHQKQKPVLWGLIVCPNNSVGPSRRDAEDIGMLTENK